MVGKVSAAILAGLLLGAAFGAPDALARRGGGGPGWRGGFCRQDGSDCRQQAGCRGPRGAQGRGDGSCPQDPSQCRNRADCPGPGTAQGQQDDSGKGADKP